MKECADLYSTIKAAYKGQGFSIGTHKSTFHEEVGLLTDILEELCPQEGQGGNEPLPMFPFLVAQNQLFSSLPLVDPVNMPLGNCGEISSVERK